MLSFISLIRSRFHSNANVKGRIILIEGVLAFITFSPFSNLFSLPIKILS